MSGLLQHRNLNFNVSYNVHVLNRTHLSALPSSWKATADVWFRLIALIYLSASLTFSHFSLPVQNHYILRSLETTYYQVEVHVYVAV